MKKKIPAFLGLIFAFTALIVFSAKAFPDKIYDNVCLEDMDIMQAIVMDLDGDDHYETMQMTWCDWQNGIEVKLQSPILYPPEASKGLPINQVAHDPFPFRLKLKKPRPPRKKTMILEFFPEDDTTTIIYDYQKNPDDPNVYYTQYVPYTDVDDPINENGISISPNPASSNVTMTMDIPLTANVLIKIYNQNGQEVGELNNNGAQEFDFDVSNLASGVYFVHTIVGTERYVNSLFVVR
jgi:hypothetical protein